MEVSQIPDYSGISLSFILRLIFLMEPSRLSRSNAAYKGCLLQCH